MNKEKFHKTLKDVKELLDANGVFFWLVSGTLLGFIREGDFIEHDTDIDIAISLDDYYKHDIPSIFKNAGHKHKQTIKIVNDGKRDVEETFKVNGIGVDVFCYDSNDTNIWTYAYIPKNNNGWLDDLQPLTYTWNKHGFSSIIINDSTYNIPENSESWLELAYGKNWKTPIKNFEYDKDTKNMSIDESLIGKLYLH